MIGSYIVGVFIVLLFLLFGMLQGIDNAAHFGGLITGFAIGVIQAPSLKQSES